MSYRGRDRHGHSWGERKQSPLPRPCSPGLILPDTFRGGAEPGATSTSSPSSGKPSPGLSGKLQLPMEKSVSWARMKMGCKLRDCSGDPAALAPFGEQEYPRGYFLPT